MRPVKRAIEIVFYLLIIVLFVSRAVSSGFGHDESQFVAAGQLLADHGLLPYVDYPYTHMPYGVAFYALSAAVSNYDFLAARLINAIAWSLCAILIVVVIRQFAERADRRNEASKPSIAQLLAEFVIVFVFLNHPVMNHIDGAALNHSYATLFGLLALLFLGRALYGSGSLRRAAFASGAFASLAALIRLNYAALVIVLLIVWVIYTLTQNPGKPGSPILPFVAGIFIPGIPALVLAALAPAHFFYTNVAYIRLNTAYYQELGYKADMTLGSKVLSFAQMLLGSPIDVILYTALAVFAIVVLVRFIRQRSAASLAGMAVTGFALSMALSAFAPTPTQPQYFFAPLPFLLVIAGILGARIRTWNRLAGIVTPVLVLPAIVMSTKVPNPLSEIAFLGSPAQWIPVQIHEFDERLGQSVPHDGPFLSLLSSLPLEAGYDVYPFTAAGGFTWRTSLLLTPQRRAEYGVTSPEELPRLLAENPPSGILTELESTNDGFVRSDPGGLERPLEQYAISHGYRAMQLPASFLRRTVTLWIRQP